MQTFLPPRPSQSPTVRLESVLVLVGLALAMALLAPNFLSLSNFLNILLATSVIGVLAIAATFVLCAAGLDLSLGSVLAVAGVTSGVLCVNLGLPWPLGLLGGLLAGGLLGLVNGLLVARAGIPAFIVTLGMLSVARGLALIIADGKPVYGLPLAITFLGQGRFLGIPMPVWVFLFLVIIFHLILSRTRFGRYTLVIGDNEMAARVTGIDVSKHKIRLYMLSGALAGLAGLLFAARVNAADPTAGVSYELSAITAAVIGGTNLFGGRGTVIGTLIGALIMGVLQNGLNLMAVPSFYQQVAIGAILVLAVWLDRARDRRRV
ncbi:ABC transporter permease [Meiothermus granaticius]|uniref:Ribose import permease protein RbsC n=1 Tax=Meiothermus granaticius NBRC 107808 TaxID=1227551 RepID=A0A399F5E7_9DEIN|nr:ABC transporter permease [Meiothermus granaticius]RIH90985.1 Ribose import permease protein RbsC [Meiothermus granaticius NBRC 107808]GEM87505.1 ABC transporter permease [Meiothermus granaticius NBRC 107808]